MLKYTNNKSYCTISILLLPDFSMLAFTNILETLRLANKISKKDIYKWSIISRDGQNITSNTGVEISTLHSIIQISAPDNVIICGNDDSFNYKDGLTFGVLRRWAREGTHIGSIEASAHILANAGILNGYKCATHWSNMAGFHENHPDIDVEANLYVVDRNRFSCSGGTAVIDMMLSEISTAQGEELAASISEQMMHERIRNGDEKQKIPLKARLRVSHPKLVTSIKIMENNMEEPLSLNDIGHKIGMSRRQLERLFNRHLNISPGRYYIKTRLDHAQKLLRQTTVPITEVAFACGFSSASHFSKTHKESFGCTPLSTRTGKPETRKVISIQQPPLSGVTTRPSTRPESLMATG